MTKNIVCLVVNALPHYVVFLGGANEGRMGIGFLGFGFGF